MPAHSNACNNCTVPWWPNIMPFAPFVITCRKCGFYLSIIMMWSRIVLRSSRLSAILVLLYGSMAWAGKNAIRYHSRAAFITSTYFPHPLLCRRLFTPVSSTSCHRFLVRSKLRPCYPLLPIGSI